MTKPKQAEMTKPEACASCGSLDLAGWVTGKPLSFKRSPRHRGREIYLCSSCFAMELEARQRDQAKLRAMELFSR
jgi:transposase